MPNEAATQVVVPRAEALAAAAAGVVDRLRLLGGVGSGDPFLDGAANNHETAIGHKPVKRQSSLLFIAEGLGGRGLGAREAILALRRAYGVYDEIVSAAPHRDPSEVREAAWAPVDAELREVRTYSQMVDAGD